MSETGAVFHIQRFSIHDGPGIRTTVFLKGCSLHCFWCHNPEGRRPSPEIQYFANRCIACGACVTACPNSAHELHDGLHVFHLDRCRVNGACVETCYPQALQLSGRMMTVEQVVEEVLADRAFYESSGGGVTLSGGEPALSGDFARRLLEECKREGLHTALETCGEYPWHFLELLLPVTDLIIMDIKLMSGERHREATGRTNDRILSNARLLAQTGKPMIMRTPIVPGVNDSEEDVRQVASFVRELCELRKTNGTADIHPIVYELLAFHRLASDKYTSLGLEYEASAIQPPTRERMSVLANVAKGCGINARIR
jgi:pyruvate formate lyase activating enzyme